MSTYKYPDGREYTPTTETVTPRKPKERKERRISAPGENSQYSVRRPAKDSPLRRLCAIYEANEWQTEYIKFPCQCQDWTNKQCNAVCVWRGTEHRIWCLCQVEKMNRQQMESEAA
jgi:hypothetical protein